MPYVPQSGYFEFLDRMIAPPVLFDGEDGKIRIFGLVGRSRDATDWRMSLVAERWDKMFHLKFCRLGPTASPNFSKIADKIVKDIYYLVLSERHEGSWAV